MKQTLITLAIGLLSVNTIFAQQHQVENASREAALVPAIGAKALADRKACAITNKSTTRTITVRVEESVAVNDFVQKKVRVFEKIAPNEQKFVGYAGCDASPLGEKCMGFKVLLAYYDDNSVAPSVNPPVLKGAAAVASR